MDPLSDNNLTVVCNDIQLQLYIIFLFLTIPVISKGYGEKGEKKRIRMKENKVGKSIWHAKALLQFFLYVT